MSDTESVYVARSKPHDDSEPFLEMVIGDSPTAAKNAIIEASRDEVPDSTLDNIEWVEGTLHDGYMATCRQDDWWFEITEYPLHTDTEVEQAPVVLSQDWCDWCDDDSPELTHKVSLDRFSFDAWFCSRTCAEEWCSAADVSEIEEIERSEHPDAESDTQSEQSEKSTDE